MRNVRAVNLLIIFSGLVLTGCGQLALMGGELSASSPSPSPSASPTPQVLNTFLYVTNGVNQVYSYQLNPATGAMSVAGGSPYTQTSTALFNPQNPGMGPNQSPVSTLIGTTLYPDFGAFSWLIDASSGAWSSASGSPVTGLSTTSFPFIDPSNRFVYLLDLTASDSPTTAIHGYQLTAATGVLGAIPGSPFAAPYIPDSIDFTNGSAVFTPSGKFLYVAVYNSTGSSAYVAAYSVDQTSGTLTALSTPSYSLLAATDAMFTDPSGKVLFVGHAGSTDKVETFLINSSSGALTPIGNYSLGTTGTVTWAFDSSGTAVYFGNSGGSHDTLGYSLNPLTGILTPLTSSPYNMGIVSGVDPSGKFACWQNLTQVGLATINTDHSLSATAGSTVTLSMTTPKPCFFSPQGNYFYFIDSNNPSSVYGFSYDTSGNITQLGGALGFPLTISQYVETAVMFNTAP